MRRPSALLAAGVVIAVALAGCAAGRSGAQAAGNPPGPVCERTLDRILKAAEAAMWNQGMWDERYPPPPVLLRPDGSPIEFSRLQDAPPMETPPPSEIGPRQEYRSLQQWKQAKKRYVAYAEFTTTAGFTPIENVLQAMERAYPANTVDCAQPGVG